MTTDNTTPLAPEALRERAFALYEPPFSFEYGYINDAKHRMVADQDGFKGKVTEGIVARVRGWGRIGYLPTPEALQDEVGEMVAQALTEFWNRRTPAPSVAAQPAPPGYVMVPLEPTPEMLAAACARSHFRLVAADAYRAMLAAAPASSAQPAPQEALDAARYRWLRDEAHPDRDDTGLACIEHDVTDWGRHFNRHLSGDELDAAIDAARASSTGETK